MQRTLHISQPERLVAMGKPHIVVLGSGGAGLTAAIAACDAGARVSLFEKHDQIGGTTAWSGGMLWMPNNHHEVDLGVDDSRDQALTYLMSLSHGVVEPAVAEPVLAAGPVMIRHRGGRPPVAVG